MDKKLKNVVVSTFLVAGVLLGGNLNADANDPCVKACNAASGKFEYNIFDEDAAKGQDPCEFAIKRRNDLREGNKGRSLFSKVKGAGCHEKCLVIVEAFMNEHLDCSAIEGY